MSGPVIYTYWEVGTFRCVLIATNGPTLYAVHVLRDDPELSITPTVVTQSCEDVEHCARIAQQLWVQFVVGLD